MKTALNRIALLLALSALLGPNAVATSDNPGHVSESALEHAQGAPDGLVDLILTYRSAPGKNDRASIESQGGKVKHKFVTIPGHAVRVPARALQGLSHNPNVHWIALDAPVASLADTSVNGVRTTVDMLLAEGLSLTGAGVTVAVLDSGVAAHSDLTPLQQVDIIAPYSSCGHRSARIERGLAAL
jgi:subtilisin family serine protease